MTSGRLTPAAATRTSTSPSPGSGTGLCLGFNCSGPPGAAISTTVISSGTDIHFFEGVKYCRRMSCRDGGGWILNEELPRRQRSFNLLHRPMFIRQLEYLVT